MTGRYSKIEKFDGKVTLDSTHINDQGNQTVSDRSVKVILESIELMLRDEIVPLLKEILG